MPLRTHDLRLQTLGNGVTALLKEYEACFGSAASYCLEGQGHRAPTEIVVSGLYTRQFPLHWQSPTEQENRTWENDQQATEFGACGVALVLMRAVAGLKAFRVARKPSGFDFWMAPKDSGSPFQKSARLEITGIRCGAKEKKSRLREKSDRLKRYSSVLPALIVVIEFGEPGALVGQP